MSIRKFEAIVPLGRRRPRLLATGYWLPATLTLLMNRVRLAAQIAEEDGAAAGWAEDEADGEALEAVLCGQPLRDHCGDLLGVEGSRAVRLDGKRLPMTRRAVAGQEIDRRDRAVLQRAGARDRRALVRDGDLDAEVLRLLQIRVVAEHLRPRPFVRRVREETARRRPAHAVCRREFLCRGHRILRERCCDDCGDVMCRHGSLTPHCPLPKREGVTQSKCRDLLRIVLPHPGGRFTNRSYGSPFPPRDGGGGLGKEQFHCLHEGIRLVVGDGVAATGEADEAGVREKR